MMQDRLCYECRFMRFDMGSPGYSEETPGDPVDIACEKGIWSPVQFYTDKVELAILLETAKRCELFEPDPSTARDLARHRARVRGAE